MRDDLKRLLTSQALFRLDAANTPRLVPIIYAAGLAGLLLWAIRHLFATFGAGFGHGLWGLLEIAVFGLLMLLVLRAGCEALLVYFTRSAVSTEAQPRTRYSASLLDEVRDAIRDLAEHDEKDFAEADEYFAPATDPAPRVSPSVRPGEYTSSETGTRPASPRD